MTFLLNKTKKIKGCSCGCATCCGLNPISRSDWKSLTNKEGRGYGVHPKGHGVKQSRR
jgi:hypothetical protein